MEQNGGRSEFKKLINAGYSIMYTLTHEEGRCMESLARQVHSEDPEKNYTIYSWDPITGLSIHPWTEEKGKKKLGRKKVNDIEAPIDLLNKIDTSNNVSFPPKRSILFLKDFHNYIEEVGIYRTLKNMIPSLSSSQRHIVIISPIQNIPVELEKDIQLMEFELPSTEELKVIGEEIVNSDPRMKGKIHITDEVVAAGKGLTEKEFSDALALSIIETKGKGIDIPTLQKQKTIMVKKSMLMEIEDPIPLSELGGAEEIVKEILLVKKGFQDPSLPKMRGMLIAGPPGCGKSLISRVVASVLQVPLIKLDLGTLMDSRVGGTEAKTRMALKIITAVDRCVVRLDEIEKTLTGVQSSGHTDAGTSAKQFGAFLTWMEETTAHAYIIGTCNELEPLLNISHGALLRRFDDLWFIDLPNNNQREKILEIMNRRYGTNIGPAVTIQMDNWSGAEIEKFVKRYKYIGDEEEALRYIRPLYQQNKAIIEKAREWAKHNARLANGKEEVDPSTYNRMLNFEGN